MARQLASRLTLALALTSSMGFLGCAEETKPAADAAAPAPTTEAPKEGMAPAEKPADQPAEKPAEGAK